MTGTGLRLGAPEADDPEPPDAAGPPPPPGGRAPRPRGRVRTTRRLVAAGLVIAAALGFLLFKGLTSAVVYFKTADEAIAERSSLNGVSFQIEGVVVPGTLRHLSGGRTAFDISSKGVDVSVVDTGQPPQLFQPCIPVVLAGGFVGSSDTFAADQILVKHSQQYVAAHPDRVKSPQSCSPGAVVAAGGATGGA